MTGIITRSHRVTCARCTDLPKEKSCCNVARHLIAATDLHKKPAKACTRGVYNENKVKVMGSKNGFRREVDKKIAQNAKHSETSVSLEKEDLRERPAAPVYKRITRAKSKYISGTETTCNDIRGDVACNDARNTTKGKNSNTRAKEPKVHTGENSSQVDIEFGEQNQDRMIEVRMTRSKKNLLLQMQPDKENAGAGCLHGHTNEESCLADSDKNPIFTHDPTLQRKRKRMSAMMYGLGHEDSYCISEKGLGSEPQTKREFPFRAITRSAIHKQNGSATINNQTIRMDRQSSAELQNQCKEVEVTHQELTVHPKSQEKLKSCKWKDLNENMSSTGLLRKPDENSMQNDEIPLGSKDSKSSRNLRNSKSTVDKEIVNPVQVSDSSPQKKLREKVVECTMEGARRAKVIATASIPKRMTRSMQKDSLELELVQINEKPVITRKRKPQDADHPMIPRKSLRIKSQSSSVTEACAAETQLRDESCVEDDNSLKINSEEPLNSTGKLKDKDQGNSRSNDASEKLNLSESIKGVEDLQGKGHLCRISKKREKQNYDMRRKEYLTRSKHDKRSIQEDKENHLSLKAEGSTIPCYKNEPNSSSKGSGYADVAPPTDELIVLPPIESVMLDTSVKQFSVDTDSEDHLSLKRKGEAKSSLQDTSGLERTENKSVDNQPLSPCYEKICDDIIPETPGYENGFCNSSGKLNLSENIQGLEDLAGKGHLCRIPKRKEKLKYDMPRKEYLTRSKHDKRNIQEDKEEHSSLKVEGSTTLCYKNGLNSCTKGPREVVVPPPTDVSIVLPPVESAKVDNSARQSSMDPDSGDHLKLKREGETKSSVQDTSGLEHMEKIPVDNLPSFPCYLQICNDTIPEALGNTNVVGEIQSGTPLVVSNIDQGVKSGDLAGSNGGPLKVSAHHVESSHGFDGNSYPESKRETCETTFISKIYSKPAKKSHESGVDEHDCVQQDDFIMGDANRKCFKIMTNPNDLGGRQMRPRPLDPLQPLPVFIEGRDQEFHDFNTVSFQWHPRHHGDEKFSIAAVMDSEHKSLSLKSKKQEIKIPSYRTVPDYDELRRNLNGGKSVYTIPGSYIRHIEMSAKNLTNISNYDIEDDDQEWLRSFNQGITERKATLQLTEDNFEELIEYFEKESAKVPADRGVKVSVLDSLRDSKDKWNPISDAGKKEIVLPCGQSSSMLSSVPQTSDCCICNGGEDSVSNSVYRCKSCGIYVHHSCYGVHGQQNAGQADSLQISDWICRKCEAFGSANVNICCAICCKNGGALKPTTNPTKWAHVVCALYTNETFFLDSDSMEPIDGVSAVEVRSRRQKRLCCFCGARVGSCERCSVYGCGAVFHISCGVNQGAYFEMQHNNQEVVNVRSFCPRHANDTHHGLIEEGSNVKDVFQIPIKDDASVPKRQRRRMLRHRIKSAVRLNRCKTVSRNKMLFVDDSLHAHKGANSSLLYLMGTSEQQQGPESSNNMQNKGANLGLVEGSVSGNLNANVSESNQFIELKEVLKANIGPAFVVREVYSYWLSKRAQKKGPLLQKLQQEETAKTHGIFNQDSAAIREYFGLKEDLSDKLAGCSSVDFKMVLRKLTELQKGLKSVRSMAEVVINREKIKAQLVSEFTMLAQTKLFALQEELGLISCFLCNSSENLLLCQQCKRIFCFQCYKHWKVHGVKSYRILSCGKCFCKDCEVVYKTDSVNNALENFSVMSKTDDRERIIQVPNSLGRSLENTVKPDGECKTKGLERKNTSFSRSITNGVCSVPKNEAVEDTDSKADASIDPNKQAINDTCSFPPFTTDTGSLKVMDGHPLDGKGRQQSPCKTALLSDLTVAVNLNNGSLGKIPSNDCHKNVQKTRSKRRN